MSVSVFPGFGKKKVGKVEYFGGNWNKITENFVSCLTAFDVNMNFPSGSYNMCFNAGKANLMLSLENSMTIGLEFKTKYSLNNISFYAFSYNYDYKPADTEKSDNIAKIGFNQATVGAAKDYTLESEKNIVFACFRGSGTINHDIYQKVKDVRQVLIDDQEIALKNKVFEKELKEAVGSASYMFPVYGFLKMKVAGQSIANETNIDLSQPVLTNNISLKDDAELKVKTTQHININAKAGKPVIFSLSDITGILDPESITEQSDNKAVIKVCNSDNLIEAAETVTLKKDDSNSLSISKNNLEINIKAGGTKVFTMNTNSIELKKSDNKNLKIESSMISAVNGKLKVTNTGLTVDKSNFTLTSADIPDGDLF